MTGELPTRNHQRPSNTLGRLLESLGIHRGRIARHANPLAKLGIESSGHATRGGRRGGNGMGRTPVSLSTKQIDHICETSACLDPELRMRFVLRVEQKLVMRNLSGKITDALLADVIEGVLDHLRRKP